MPETVPAHAYVAGHLVCNVESGQSYRIPQWRVKFCPNCGLDARVPFHIEAQPDKDDDTLAVFVKRDGSG